MRGRAEARTPLSRSVRRVFNQIRHADRMMSATELEGDGLPLPVVSPRDASTVTAIACRVLDVVVAIPLLILLLPLFAVIAVAVRLDSPGPVLFRQRRCGLGLSEFTMNKFRTMHSGTSADRHREFVVGLIRNGIPPKGTGGLYKLETDDRITRVGRVLRRCSLDELPQLWNVVVGDMSLVGPRPSILYEVESFPREWCERFSVKPGMTGLWQVNGRSQVGLERMIELDLAYARDRSFWLNVRIIAKTVLVVLGGKGAA
jgi:lipopolysaccharide/colanic/teichoic acid biosynthesis glycosyltransferase